MKIIEDGTVTNPKGYKGAGLHIGIKKRNKDFALIALFSECVFKKSSFSCFFESTLLNVAIKAI